MTLTKQSRTSQGRPAFFLDRDGTINVEKDYLCHIDDFEFIQGVPAAICRLNLAGFLVVVVTNQSGVARGYYGLEDVHRLHRRIEEMLQAQGARIDRFYICPHHPDHGSPAVRCRCRKPSPGLLLQAAEELDIDLAASYMVGDKVSDLEAGRRAGCTSILVETGYGKIAARSDAARGALVVPSLREAVDMITGVSLTG